MLCVQVLNPFPLFTSTFLSNLQIIKPKKQFWFHVDFKGGGKVALQEMKCH